MDYTPLNKKQADAMKLIAALCRTCVSDICEVIKSCPGLFEKGYTIELSLDTKYETIGNKVKIDRTIVNDGQICKEQYYIQKGFGEHDKGWEELRCLCTEEFTSLLNGKTEGEGTGEGTGQ